MLTPGMFARGRPVNRCGAGCSGAEDRETALPGGGSAAWREWGATTGDPVVFLHGTPGSRLFCPDPATRARLITVDRPGYGRSTPLEVPTLTGFAEIVGRIADEADLRRFAVIGFSGGGPYALACGALLGDRVSCVGVVSSWGPVDELEAAHASLTAEERQVLAAVRADPAGATALLCEHGQWYADTPLRFLEADREPADEAVLGDAAFRSTFADTNLEGALQGQAGLVCDWVADALPWGFRLADIGVPVDLWVGEQDSGRAPLDAAEIVRRIPSCTVHACEDEGHWLLIPRWPEILERSLAHR
jgi:pimeloyl-ACP methyl ester carboxylesterase